MTARTTHSTFYTTIAVFFVILVMAFGAVFYVRDKKIKEQRELYSLYTSMNAWQAPTRASYARLKPHLEFFNKVDMASGKDLAAVKVAHAAFAAERKVFTSAPASSRYAQKLARESADVFSWYDGAMYDYIQLWTMDSDQVARQMVEHHVARMIAIEQSRTVPKKNLTPSRTAWMRAQELRLRATTAKMTNDELRKIILKSYNGFNLVELRANAQRTLEKTLDMPEYFPEGLDLEFARKHP